MGGLWRALGGVMAGALVLAGCGVGREAEQFSGDKTPTRGGVSKTTTKVPDQGKRISIVATGDVLLHERLWTTARRDGRNGQWDFAPMLRGIKPLVEGADLALCHLETPLAPEGGPYQGFPRFSGPPQIATALKQTGYDACTTASNHSFDAGAAGVDRTLATLDAAGLGHAGTARTREEAETPAIVEVRGVKVALLSYTYGFNGLPYPRGETWRAGKLDVPTIKAMARKARRMGAELVLVSCHWGDEYSSRVNDQQRAIARELVADSAIDLVLGHHAHVVQPMERMETPDRPSRSQQAALVTGRETSRAGGKWVVYGMGNLVAAHREPGTTRAEGLLVRFTFKQIGDRWAVEQAGYAPLLVTDTLPVRVLDVQRERVKPGLTAVQRRRLELAQRRTTQTVTSLGAEPSLL